MKWNLLFPKKETFKQLKFKLLESQWISRLALRNVIKCSGFELVKQNQFTKISKHSEEKDLPQAKKFLDLQIIL